MELNAFNGYPTYIVYICHMLTHLSFVRIYDDSYTRTEGRDSPEAKASMARDKRSKFVELTNNRMNRAIRDIRLIGNLSNRAAYEYSEEDVRKVLKALQRELDSVRARFTSSGSGADGEFSL
jgi:hypothetical protein